MFGQPFQTKQVEGQQDPPPSQTAPTHASLPPSQSPPASLPTTIPTSQYSEYNTLSGRLPPPHKPAVNLTTTTPNVKTPPCTAAFGSCPCPQSVAWQFAYRNCAPSFFPLPQNCEIRPYPDRYRVYDLNPLIYERSRVLGSDWNPYHFWNNQQGMYQFLASNLILNNDPNLKPMNLNRPITQYCFGCPVVAGQPVQCPPRYLSF